MQNNVWKIFFIVEISGKIWGGFRKFSAELPLEKNFDIFLFR